MVSIQLKDIFLTKSGLRRIDQLLGMKNKDHLCLIQAEDNVVLFEVWDMFEERIIQQKKVSLYNYELSSNVITLETNQLAFYGVIQETGVQCLFLVDIFFNPNSKQRENEMQKSVNEKIIKMMIDEQELEEGNEDIIMYNKNYPDNPESDILYRKDTAVSLNPQTQKKAEDNINDFNHYKQSTFKQKNKDVFDINILDVDEEGNVGLKEDIQKRDQQKNIHSNGKIHRNSNQKNNSFEENNIQSLPVIEDKNLPLFLEQLEDRQEISLMNSFITQDFQGISGANDLQTIIDDINCINNFEYTNHNRNDMLNYKEFLPTDYKKEAIKIEKDMIKEENNLSLRDNFSFTNGNIKNHNIKNYAPDYQPSSHSYEQNMNANNSNSDNQNTNQQNAIKQKTIFQSGNKNNCSNQFPNSRSGSNNENGSGIEYGNKYLGEGSGDIKCIYDTNQKELFSKCVEFFSEIYGQGYHGIIIVKNTYYMTNYDDSYYMLLVLSVYRTGNTQQFAQYIIRKEINDLNNNVQIICVQNSHQVIIYDPSNDELIVWSYFADPLLPSYYTFQQFQSLIIKYCFQNGNNPDTYHFVYKDPQSNLYKILSYDFKTGNNITKGFPNKEMHHLRSPIIIKQQESYVIKSNKQFLLVICTIYKNSELTTYWNVYQLNCTNSKKNENDEGFLSQIHTHLEASETDNNDIKTHFVPDYSLVSPNVYFFNTSDIHIDVQSAINTFIFNQDIHFKAITILKE